MTEQTPGIGDNQPSELETLNIRAAGIVEAANVWIATVPEIETEEVAEKCDDFLNQITAEIKAVEANRGVENEPHKVAVKDINESHYKLHHYKNKNGLLDICKRLLNEKATAWLQKKEAKRLEDQRIAEEVALKKLQEAEDAAALEAPTVQDIAAAETAREDADAAVKEADRIGKEHSSVKGNFSTRSRGLRTGHWAVITDMDKAIDHYRDHPKMHDLIQELANADARNPEKRKTDIPGVEFKSEQKAA